MNRRILWMTNTKYFIEHYKGSNWYYVCYNNTDLDAKPLIMPFGSLRSAKAFIRKEIGGEVSFILFHRGE